MHYSVFKPIQRAPLRGALFLVSYNLSVMKKVDRELMKPEFIRVGRLLIRLELIRGFEAGEYTAEEFLDGSVLPKMWDAFQVWKRQKSKKVFITPDHTETIIEEAKRFAELKKYDNARMFYALYFEHELNGILHKLLARMDVSDSSRKAILRLSFRDKATWLMEILGQQSPAKFLLAYVERLSDERNNYVHYKYLGKDIEAEEDLSLIKKAPKMVSYFKAYRTRLIYKGKKKLILKKINELVPFA